MSRRLALAFSSGDLIADRRLQLAREYAMAGGYAAAAELTEQALELVPAWPAGWFALGEFREAAAGEPDADRAAFLAGAIEAFRAAIAGDPEDHCGAGLRLARLGAGPAPDAPPPAHVRDLFDGYADRFDTSLLQRLAYQGPRLIGEALAAAVGDRRFASALDLGCGTGLMAPVVRARVDRLEGVDLAPAMVAKARALGLYDALGVGEIVADMAGRPAGAHDLLIAGDVFCYLGDLGPAFAAAGRVARAGAVFAFTTELVEDDEAGGDVVLRHSLRYAHRRGHVEGAAKAAGFSPLSLEAATIRQDGGQAIRGLVSVFTRGTGVNAG